MLKRFYPSSEGFLLDIVDKEDLFGYVFCGFAEVTIDGVKCYVSYNKPGDDPFIIRETPEVKEVLRAKVEGQNNLSAFTKLYAKLTVIHAHYKDTEEAWKRVGAELEKEEYKETLGNYSVTIATLIKKMFPGFNA